MLVLFVIFHIEISGKDNNEEHPENKHIISVTFSVIHFDISGNDFKEEQL